MKLNYNNIKDFYNRVKINRHYDRLNLSKEIYFLCSFQKSGRTWLRFLIANYLNDYYALGYNINFQNIYDILPAYNQFDDILSSNKKSKKYKYPLILLTHRTYNKALFKSKNVIFLVRSPFDVMVSYFFHNKKHHTRYDGEIHSFIREPSIGIKKWINYINSWSEYILLSNSIVISYEEMHKSLDLVLIRLFKSLKIPINKNTLINAIEKSSITNMREVEKKNKIKNHKYNMNDPEALRMRKGKIDGYKNYLNDDDIEFILENCNHLLTLESKKLLKIKQYDFKN